MKTRYALLVAFLGISFQFFASEYFLKVNRIGNFQVSVSGQMQTNSTATYRFFDIGSGSMQVIVTDISSNIVVFNNYVQIGANMRTVAELDAYGNMTIIGNIPITVSNWYTTQTTGTVINNGGGHGGTVGNVGGNGTGTGGTYDPQAEASFNEFLKFLDDQSFDSGKLEEAKKYVALSSLSAQQIKSIAQKFTYDSNRLDFAKAAYANCRDKANYFVLKSTFQYTTNYSELEEYIKTH